MKLIYLVLALIPLIGVSLVNGQCDKLPTVWKRPEECCKFNLIKDSDFAGCKEKDNQGDKKPPKGKQPPAGEEIKGSCIIECAFNKSGLFDGKQLIENQIRTVFTKAVNGNDGLTKAVNDALESCLPLTKTHAADFQSAVTDGAKCNPITMFLFMCVTTKVMAKCPAADFQTKDPKCVTLQKYFVQCPNGPH